MAPTAVRRPAYDPGMELWERAEALELLDDLLRASATGGRVALVAGEAGIGKSALVDRVRRGGRGTGPGCCGAPATGWSRRARSARCTTSAGRPVACWPSGSPAGRPRRRSSRRSWTSWRRTRRRLQVVVVEDAHWADEATLDWLVFLGRRMERLPALLVVTYRDDEVGPDHPLRGVLGAMPAAVVDPRAGPARCRASACSSRRAGPAATPSRSTGWPAGTRCWSPRCSSPTPDAVPGAVQDLILDRIRAPARGRPRRGPPGRRGADPRRAPRSTGDVGRGRRGASTAGVLVPAGDGVAYRHELLRSAVEDSLSPARRAELHRRVLQRCSTAPGVDPGRLVHHARLAGDADAVLRYGQVAGAERASGRARTGRRRRTTAPRRRTPIGWPSRSARELLERYGFAAYLAGRYEEALGARKAALAVREELGQPELVGENLRWISRILWWTGQTPQEARAAPRRAIAVLEAAPPGRELAMAYSNRAQLAITAHLVDEAAAWRPSAPALAEQLGDAETASARRGHRRALRGCYQATPTPRSRDAGAAARGRRRRRATSSTPAARSRTWPW